jgi:hypothetical protein
LHRRRQVEKEAPRAVIENGVLIAVGKTALLRFDARAGVVSVRYDDGTSYDFSGLTSPSGDRLSAPTFVWVRGESSTAKGGNCGRQADALLSAIATVQHACGGGPSAACSQAIALLQTLYVDYLSCLNRVQ